MATTKTKRKKTTIIVQLASSEGTGYFYTTKRNPKKLQRKLSFRKYDPVANKHVVFNEIDLKKNKKKNKK